MKNSKKGTVHFAHIGIFDLCNDVSLVIVMNFYNSNVDSDLTLLEPTLETLGDVHENLISVLQSAQEIYGYLPTDVIIHISQKMCIPVTKIIGVATFYSQFRLTPIGKYLIMLCKGTACHVNGANSIYEAISEHLGIEDNETTADGLFTVKCVACLGCCSLSPVMMINDDTYGNLTPEKAVNILKALAEKEEN